MDNVGREGEILAGKYRVDRVLGAGGMGVVVAAHHIELDSRVAIKFLLPETLNNPEAVARFSREARAAVKIKSEHVARVSDVGKLDSGAPYMVMEYLEGLDLSAWLSQRGPLPIEQAVEFILQASEAVAEAHSLGIVHRDLKPANLFIVRRPDGGLSAKVLDFGISKASRLGGSGGEGSMTKTSTMLGSPLYMSPEHIQSSKNVDARTDVWALGVILYELVTGQTPFGGEHLAELMFAIISGAPAPMQSYRPDVPQAFERVIWRCLEKRRDARFSSVAELATALAPFAPARSAVSLERITGVTSGATAATVSLAGSEGRHAPAGTQASWGNTAVENKRRSPWLVAGGLGAGVALLALVVAVRGLTAGDTTTHAAGSAATTLATSAPSVVQPDAPQPEPVVSAPTSVTSATAAPSATTDKTAPAASSLAKPPRIGKPRSSAAASASPPRDPWGGSQH